MSIKMEDVQVVLFNLHLAAARGILLDPEGSRTRALWNSVLPLCMPEPGDPELTDAWHQDHRYLSGSPSREIFAPDHE